MEKGLERLIEAAKVAEEPNDDFTNRNFFLSITSDGVRVRLVFDYQGKPYSLEHTVSWREVHPRPDTKNPLIGAMDKLMQEYTEFTT